MSNQIHLNKVLSMKFSTNILNNVCKIVDVYGEEPVIIEKDQDDKLYVTIRFGYPKQKWHDIILRNEAKSPDYKVLATSQKVEVRGRINGKNHLIMTVMINENGVVEVKTLDLRPIGMNFYANKEGLFIAGDRYNNNIYENLETLVRITNE